ncbi:PD-(D/E)XK nuclease-like domain-containing protein [Rhizorhabdus histidinilytica]|uniref:PD-(D/E)XK nuclease-like domain-containing protein n=1 Tax=Rhizorhabdus histidinilytica TaxID=439228 RepID=UPI001F2807E2|nr:PD-(D/E)XK nuclease-like domain-containing protein [Rhizorhabdus histidinilytica]
MMTDNPFADGYVAPQSGQSDILGDMDRERKPEAPAPQPVATDQVLRIPSADYHADPAPEPSLSATLAKLLLGRSPLHAWMQSPRLNPDCKPIHKKTFDIGRAAHRAVLGCGDDYVTIPADMLASNGEASTAAAKSFIADARDRGLTPLKADEVEQIEAMRDIAHARLHEYGIEIDPDRSELCAVTKIDDVWCRAMFDHVPADPRLPILDFKTCEDASPAACLRAILNYGYHIQYGHYLDVWKAVTGEDRRFAFVFQEKSQPNEVSVIGLSGSFAGMAQRRAARARKLWGECVTTNKWPGYPVGIYQIDPPNWLVERELQEDF